MWPRPSPPSAASCATRSTRCAPPGVEVESSRSRPAATRAARTAPPPPGGRFDVVHAHFGLTAWPALALRGAPHAVTLHGTDLRHPRTRRLTRAALPFCDLVAAVGESWPPSARRRGASATPVLPCGVDLDALPSDAARRGARARSACPPTSRSCCSPPTRRARRSATTAPREVAGDAARCCTLGGVDPTRCRCGSTPPTPCSCPPSARASASPCSRRWPATCPCSPPRSASTPSRSRASRARCARPSTPSAWRAALAPHLARRDPRVAGRRSADAGRRRRWPRRVIDAWRRAASVPNGAGKGAASA